MVCSGLLILAMAQWMMSFWMITKVRVGDKRELFYSVNGIWSFPSCEGHFIHFTYHDYSRKEKSYHDIGLFCLEHSLGALFSSEFFFFFLSASLEGSRSAQVSRNLRFLEILALSTLMLLVFIGILITKKMLRMKILVTDGQA